MRKREMRRKRRRAVASLAKERRLILETLKFELKDWKRKEKMAEKIIKRDGWKSYVV